MDEVDVEYTPDQFYDMIKNPEKLKSYNGVKMVMAKGLVNHMGFYDDLPFDEIKQFIGEEREAILSKIPPEVISSAEVQWEHVGSTSIKGMPGTIFPDSLILFKEYPPPREAFDALLENNFLFIGSGPFEQKDLWFLKKISKDGSRLDGAIFKIHLTPATLGASRLLIETRDRCNKNPEDFEEYKNAKVEAAKHLANGNIQGYKAAKMGSKLLQELTQKYGIKKPGPPQGPPAAE